MNIMNQDDRIEAYLTGAASAECLTDEDVVAL
jgi:hypothetical protein